jgi:hypothetical protein
MVKASCERGNEPPCYVNCWEILCVCGQMMAFQKCLISVELFSHFLCVRHNLAGSA